MNSNYYPTAEFIIEPAPYLEYFSWYICVPEGNWGVLEYGNEATREKACEAAQAALRKYRRDN